jgi:predicted SAM-dependent methyltransferase
MDLARFPLPNDGDSNPRDKKRLLFAGLVGERIKGLEVLREACRLLWANRQDFELLITGELPAKAEPFLKSVGWHSQEELPGLYQAADLVVVPSIAQEGLSRTAVEAMASARPVVGSRLGGLAELIEDGVTGLLSRPGDAGDLAERITKLLDDPDLRRTIGRNGRCRFEEDFSWPTVIERDYVPLLQSKRNSNHPIDGSPQAVPAVSARRQLEIGPGENPLAGFETLDMAGQATYHARWGFERLADRVGLMAYDEVYASHVLEHVLWNHTQYALRNVYEILKPGGLFEVWVPDFEYIVACYQRRVCGDQWRRDNSQGDPMLWVNGRIFTYGPKDNNFHQACFDYEHLSNCLSQAGFVEIERITQRKRGVSHGPIDLGVRCRRPCVDSGKERP